MGLKIANRVYEYFTPILLEYTKNSIQLIVFLSIFYSLTLCLSVSVTAVQSCTVFACFETNRNWNVLNFICKQKNTLNVFTNTRKPTLYLSKTTVTFSHQRDFADPNHLYSWFGSGTGCSIVCGSEGRSTGNFWNSNPSCFLSGMNTVRDI